MDPILFVKGLVLGFSVAAPVGPIGLLCIRRTLADGRASGFLTGLGAATADAMYGVVAAMGLTAITGLLLQQAEWIRLFGGVFLCFLGVKTLLARPATETAEASAAGLVASYASSFTLTVTNPMTILSFVAVFSGMGLVAAGNGYGGAVALVAGVFLGSAAWWLMLSFGVGALRRRFGPRQMLWVNRIAGTIILAFAGILLRKA